MPKFVALKQTKVDLTSHPRGQLQYKRQIIANIGEHVKNLSSRRQVFHAVTEMLFGTPMCPLSATFRS